MVAPQVAFVMAGTYKFPCSILANLCRETKKGFAVISVTYYGLTHCVLALVMLSMLFFPCKETHHHGILSSVLIPFANVGFCLL